jgi:PKD repeat protein
VAIGRRLPVLSAIAVAAALGLAACGDDDDAPETAPPVASFTYEVDLDTTGSTVCTVRTVAFTDTSSGDPTAWAWAWSDGQSSTDANPTWEPDGAPPIELEVTLTVENDGGTSTDTETIGFPVC